MFLRILRVAILLMCAVSASAQSLRFTVLEKDNRQPVELAYVNVYSSANVLLSTTQTDEAGVAAVTAQYPCKIEVIVHGFDAYNAVYEQAPANTSISVLLNKKYSSLNEVVVTGVNQPVKLKNALAVYQVIPASVIQAQGAVTLNEALKNQLNMSVGNDNILGSNIRMQGMGGDKVKILIDGMPVNGREGGNINLSQINMNNVERIEIIQGPMSVMYGTDALGGVINVITKREVKKFNLRGSGYYESVGKYNGNGSVSFKVKDKHQFTVGGGRNFFGGYLNIDSVKRFGNDSILTQRSFYFKPNEQYIGNLAYNFVPSSSFRLNFNSDFLREKISNKGSLQSWDPFLGAYAFDEYYYTTRSSNRLMMQGKVGKNGIWQSQNAYAVYYRVRNKLIKDLTNMESNLTRGIGDQDTTLFQNVTLRGTYANKWKALNYTAGYDINLEFAHSLKIGGYDKTLQDYALFTNVSYNIIKDKLTAQGGLRGSYNTTYNPPLIPSLHLMYTPLLNWQIRASYSKGFRAPALKEMYLSFIDQNHNIIGNANIRAEHSNHFQLSSSYQIYERGADYIQVIATGFYNDVKDGIVLVPVHPEDPYSIEYTYSNFVHMSNAIGNLQLDGQWRNFHAVLGYSYSQIFSEKNYYTGFGASEATAMLQYGLRKYGFNFNAFYKLTGAQPFLQNSIEGFASYAGKQFAFHTLDASVEKKLFSSRVHIIAGVKNILDVRSRQVTGIALGGGGAHGTGGAVGFFMPRSFYTTLNLNID